MRAHKMIVACSLIAGSAWAPTFDMHAPDDAAAVSPLVDHHQHLIGPEVARLWGRPAPFTADALIAQLDGAGIRRAVVLSLAYALGSPWGERPTNEYAAVRAENDWTAAEAAKYPDRLVAVCSVNPLRDYALAEIERCAADARLRNGLKLHFANSGANLRDATHVARLKLIFGIANRLHLPIVAHIWTGDDRVANPFDARDARVFLSDVLPMAPDVPVQIAHLGGSGPRIDPGTRAAMTVLADAMANKEAATRHVYVDIATNVMERSSGEDAAFMAARMRQVGLTRVLYGSDGPPNPPPADSWRVLRQKSGLMPQELEVIARNVAPHLSR